ncbi:hypothetical protein BGX34_003828 [Mortierella sp. NVP85]|nr:hypothetical protein BGX34_003828 [Mortierella sp. NVP85]
MSNMITTDEVQLHAVAYDLLKPHRSRKAQVGVQDLSKVFPDRATIEEVFGEQPKTMVVGCDPGEIITAAFCAVDPQNPEQVQNLSIKCAALYAPVFAYRDELARRKEEAGIYEIEEALPTRMYQSSKELEERLAGVETLRSLYGSSDMKKLNWERATRGALSMVKDKDQALFVIGNARFNTHQSLATLHESFKGHFYQQVTHATSLAPLTQIAAKQASSDSIIRLDPIKRPRAQTYVESTDIEIILSTFRYGATINITDYKPLEPSFFLQDYKAFKSEIAQNLAGAIIHTGS